MRKLLISVLAIAALVITALPKSAAAATAPNGITVSPAFQQVQVLANEAQHELDFSLTNHLPSTEDIKLTTQDFNELSDTGGLFFVGTNPTALQKKYGLASWLSLPQTSVTLAPQQTAKIVAFIRNDTTLAPGGHYGAVLFGLSSVNAALSNNKVAVQPIASSLLFVNKLGGDTHKLKLAGVNAKHGRLTLPALVTLRFYNDGNTHITPRGTVTITNPSGKVVSQGIINQNSNIILPQVYRDLAVPLQKVAAANQPGHYKLTVNFRIDGIEQYRVYQATILLATPGAYVAFVVLALITAGIMVYYLKKYRSKPRAAKPPKKGNSQSKNTAKKVIKIPVDN